MSLALLGPPEIDHGGQALRFPTRKTLALLIYLAVEGGRQPRDTLAALFWPNADGEHARMNLRGALAALQSGLRRGYDGVPGHLVVEHDAIAFARGSEALLDLEVLHTASQLERETPDVPLGERIARRRAAAQLYRGDFLDGFSLGDAPDFDNWAGAQREAWHRRAEQVFDRLSRDLSEGGQLSEAIETAARWVSVDPLNEIAHRRLIRLHFGAGDRAAALRAYDACRSILARDLQAEPAPETEALVARIRAQTNAGRRTVTSSRKPRSALPVETRSPFVGRIDEHARLVGAYRLARRGTPRIVLVEGELGIGKTRLATEFLGWARAQGADVLVGRALATQLRLPYHPLIDALRVRLAGGDLPTADHGLGNVWLAELARLLPELRDQAPDLPMSPDLGEAEARIRLFEAFARLGIILAARATRTSGGPLVLYLDDVQWADAATLDALQYAIRRWFAERTPVLIVLTARSGDPESSSAFEEWLAGVARDLPPTRFTLPPLSREETFRLIDGLATVARTARTDGPDAAEPATSGGPAKSGSHVPVDESVAPWVFAETAGHPFYVVETVKSLVERGLVRPAEGGGWEVNGALPAGRESSLSDRFVAPGIHDVIRSRLARLGPVSLQMLVATAVVGDGGAFETVMTVASVDEDQALTAVDDLLGAQLIREDDARYVFAHDKIREVVYADASEARRRTYHRRALDRLASQDAAPAELARHALAIGEPDLAFRYCVLAGDAALRLFAVRDAIAYYERAMALSQPANGDLYAQVGHAYELAAQYDRARQAYQAMLAHARSHGDRIGEATALNRLANLTGHDRLDFGEQQTLLREALAVAEASGDPVGLVEAEWNLAQNSFYRLDHDGARLHVTRALARAREAGLAEHVARNLNWLGLMEVMWGEYGAGEEHAEEARRLYAELGNRAMEADSLAHVAGARIRSGRPAEGNAAAREAMAISRAIENKWGIAAAAHHLALGLIEVGSYAEALAVADEGTTAARGAGYPPLVLLNLVPLGSLRRRLGALDVALSLHAEAVSLGQAVGYPPFVELAASELCADYAMAGEWSRAHELALQVLASRNEAFLLAGLTHQYVIEALVRAGDVDRAAADVDHFGARFRGKRRYRIPYLRARAVLAEWRQQATAAIDHLAEARDLAKEIGLPGETCEIQRALARLYRLVGDAARADEAAANAAKLLGAIGDGIEDPSLRRAFLERYEGTQGG